MRWLLILALLSGPLSAAASKVAPKPATLAELARSPLGLLIKEWGGWEGYVSLTVQNVTTSSAKFDFHQLLGVVEQTGEVIEAGNVRFDYLEAKRATYWLEPGEKRQFHVVFPGGRRVAGLSWKGTGKWSLPGAPLIVDTPEAAIKQYRERIARGRIESRKAEHKAAAKEMGVDTKKKAVTAK